MTRPRRASHRDANQQEIVDGLRALGYTVIDISAFIGWADLAVFGLDWATQQHAWRFMELKTATGTLTDKERDFQMMHPDAVQTVRTVEEAMAAFGRGEVTA